MFFFSFFIYLCFFFVLDDLFRIYYCMNCCFFYKSWFLFFSFFWTHLLCIFFYEILLFCRLCRKNKQRNLNRKKNHLYGYRVFTWKNKVKNLIKDTWQFASDYFCLKLYNSFDLILKEKLTGFWRESKFYDYFTLDFVRKINPQMEKGVN